MTRLPAFQFYPADWLNDIKLQSCSLAAQGLLMNLMCLMHQSEEYGYLLLNGSLPPMKDVTRLLRLHYKTYQAGLKELLSRGVLKADKRGVIFCDRMVKDEHIREVRREAGKLGGNPLLKQQDKQNSKQKTTPSSSSSSSSSTSKIKELELPNFINPETWKAFKDHRRKMRLIMTPHAEKLIINKLIKFQEDGIDPNAALDEAIEKSWRSVFAPKGEGPSEADQIRNM